MPEPEPPSLDAEAMKALKFRLEGEEEWRVLSEADLLEAFREAKIPSSTLFRRGDDGTPRTLAALVSWNGRECPFADFSHPDTRRGASRAPAGSTDENHNCNLAAGDAGRARGEVGGEGGQDAVFARFVAYMDTIGERMTSIEKLLTEQQSRLGGAEMFMKKVAVLEARVKACEKTVKGHDRRLSTMHELFYAIKRPGDDPFMLPGTDLAALLAATKQAQAEAAEKCADLAMYKEEVAAMSSLGSECTKRLENLDDRYAQLVHLLAAHERNVDVREALEEWNLKQQRAAEERARQQKEDQEEQQRDKELLALRSTRQPVPLPRRANALPSVAAVSLLDIDLVQAEAARQQHVHTLEGRMRAALPQTPAGDRVAWLLLGRRPEERQEGDELAGPMEMKRLSDLGRDLFKAGQAATSKLTEMMDNPNIQCICGAKLSAGQTVIAHFNTPKHIRDRANPVYMSDVQYWTDIAVNLSRPATRRFVAPPRYP